MQIIELPKEDFSVFTLQDKYNNGQLKDHLDAVHYIQKYYYEISGGMYYFYDAEKDSFEFKTDKDFKKEVLDKLNNDKTCVNIFKQNPKVFKIITKIGNPRIYSQDNKFYINESGAFKHQIYKKYSEYSQDIKEKVNMILNMIKTISCGNDDEMFKATMRYYGQIARGIKTEIILVKKTGAQGVGKSTEPEFFMKYVFGMKVSFMMPSSLEPLLTPFNKALLGKLYIVIEDLQDLSENQWKQTTAKLKTLTTEKYCFFRDVYEKGIQAENIGNFVITSNYDIRDSQGRRIITQDISLSKKGDTEYFGNIRKQCFNDLIGEAFFSYLLTELTDEECKNFYGQRDFPLTDNKRISIANSLSSVYKFLKFEYVIKKQPIAKIIRNDFFDEYKSFCVNNNFRATGKTDFYKKLEEVGINAYASNSKNYFKCDYEKLKEISDKEKWICRFDDVDENIPTDDSNSLDNEKDTKNNNEELENKNKALDIRNKELEQINNALITQIEQLRAEMEKLTKSKVLLKDGEIYNCYDTNDDKITVEQLDSLFDNILKEKEPETKYKFKKNKSIKLV